MQEKFSVSHDWDALIVDLDRWNELNAAQRGTLLSRAAKLPEGSDEQRTTGLRSVARLATQPAALDDRSAEKILDALSKPPLPDGLLPPVVALYRRLGGGSRARAVLLASLAATATRPALAALADLLACDPPALPADVDRAFIPLFRQPNVDAGALFPRLLDALQHPSAAAVVLDLANHLTRSQRVASHPASSRSEQLIQLLGAVVERLRRLEEHPTEFGGSPAELRRIVAEGLPLVVGLSDALGLIGDERAVGKLHQALELSHRRLRIEAACALARLGQDAGRQALLELTAQPVARVRALAYLEELGLLDRVPAEHCSPAARAEGEFAEWLAAPAQFGLAPNALMLVDECRQFWPGCDQPVDCYLIDFEYRLPRVELSGVGMAGPITHAFAADLSDLPPSDIYAAYAGWSTEHDQIVETDAQSLPAETLARFEPIAASLREQGYDDLRLVLLGLFFGEEHWVLTARRGTAEGVVVRDAQQAHWLPIVATQRPPGPVEMYNIVKGRKLLRTFNPPSPP